MSSKPPVNLPGRGTETVAISDRGGFVVLHFDKPTEWLALDAETARQVAEKIARLSYKVKFGDDPTPQRRSQITEALRLRLAARVALMLKSLGGKPYEIQANQIVDACLKEVA